MSDTQTQTQTVNEELPLIITVVATEPWIPPNIPSNNEVEETASAKTAEDKPGQEPIDDEDHITALYLVHPTEGATLERCNTVLPPRDTDNSSDIEATATYFRTTKYDFKIRPLPPLGKTVCPDNIRQSIVDFTAESMAKCRELGMNDWEQKLDVMPSFFGEGDKIATQLGKLTKIHNSTHPEQTHGWIQKQHDSSHYKDIFKIKFAKNREEFLNTRPELWSEGEDPDEFCPFFDEEAHQRYLNTVWGDSAVAKGNAFVEPSTKRLIVPVNYAT